MKLIHKILIVFFLIGIVIAADAIISPNPSSTKNKAVISFPSPQATKSCSKTPTPAQTEGPYYKSGSPQRKNIGDGVSGSPRGEAGKKLVISGYVYDTTCTPLAHAWLDFWQADGQGEYDLQGFKLRGHQFTDNSGRFELTTIVPAQYDTRPPHIHVKVRAENGEIITSQLYFPNASQNQTDPIFNTGLVMEVTEGQDGKVGKFDFVLNQ